MGNRISIPPTYYIFNPFLISSPSLAVPCSDAELTVGDGGDDDDGSQFVCVQIGTENNLHASDVMVTAGANQVREKFLPNLLK